MTECKMTQSTILLKTQRFNFRIILILQISGYSFCNQIIYLQQQLENFEFPNQDFPLQQIIQKSYQRKN